MEEAVPRAYDSGFSYRDVDGHDRKMTQKNLILPEEATAPIKAGQQAGEAQYTLNGEVIGTVPILFAASVKKAVYRDYVIKIIGYFLL